MQRGTGLLPCELCHSRGVPGWVCDEEPGVLVALTVAARMRAQLPPRVVIRHGPLAKMVAMKEPFPYCLCLLRAFCPSLVLVAQVDPHLIILPLPPSLGVDTKAGMCYHGHSHAISVEGRDGAA